MGSNPTQAMATLLFFVAFTLLAVAFAGGGAIGYLGFMVAMAASVALFLKCKPWENASGSSKETN
ncbi:MAG: hypothetical protein ABI824_05235 [Acidobacteriota bacterium]